MCDKQFLNFQWTYDVSCFLHKQAYKLLSLRLPRNVHLLNPPNNYSDLKSHLPQPFLRESFMVITMIKSLDLRGPRWSDHTLTISLVKHVRQKWLNIYDKEGIEIIIPCKENSNSISMECYYEISTCKTSHAFNMKWTPKDSTRLYKSQNTLAKTFIPYSNSHTHSITI